MVAFIVKNFKGMIFFVLINFSKKMYIKNKLLNNEFKQS